MGYYTHDEDDTDEEAWAGHCDQRNESDDQEQEQDCDEEEEKQEDSMYESEDKEQEHDWVEDHAEVVVERRMIAAKRRV